MRKFIHLKFISTLLLFAILSLMVNGVHERAHAVEIPVNSATLSLENSPSNDAPCTPFEHHQDYDGCDTCINCACHAPLSNALIQLSYNPIIRDLLSTDPFKFLPEVYLTKFIPPQILA